MRSTSESAVLAADVNRRMQFRARSETGGSGSPTTVICEGRSEPMMDAPGMRNCWPEPRRRFTSKRISTHP